MDPNVVFILEVIGTVTFAFSGAYVAINQDLDWLGIMLMACCTACGGGMTRDVIIDNTPANLFKNPTYVAMAAVVAFITIAIYKPLMQHEKRKTIMFVIDSLDAVGLAIFTVVGMQVAIGQGFGETVVEIQTGNHISPSFVAVRVGAVCCPQFLPVP